MDRWTGWRRELGWALVALSLAVPCVTVVVTGPGLPFQDEPTPAMLAQQAHQMRVAEVAIPVAVAFGLACFVVGVWLIVRGRHLARAAGRRIT
jgi:hypothetical protein